MRTKLVVAAYLGSIVLLGPDLGWAQDLSALEAAVKNHACPANPAAVRRLDALTQCDPGGKASAASKTDEAKSPQPTSVKPTAKPATGPQPQQDQAERPRKGREAAQQQEAARQNAEMVGQQRIEQNARETAGRICIADEGGYLIDTWTKKSPAWGVCQDLCNHTPATGLPPPVDGAQDLGKRDRYCEKQCQASDASGARCYQIKPDQRATVLQALRLDWEVHEESQFLPAN